MGRGSGEMSDMEHRYALAEPSAELLALATLIAESNDILQITPLRQKGDIVLLASVFPEDGDLTEENALGVLESPEPASEALRTIHEMVAEARKDSAGQALVADPDFDSAFNELLAYCADNNDQLLVSGYKNHFGGETDLFISVFPEWAESVADGDEALYFSWENHHPTEACRLALAGAKAARAETEHWINGPF